MNQWTESHRVAISLSIGREWTRPDHRHMEVMCWKDWMQWKCCRKCFLLLCSLERRAETGSGERDLEVITGTQGEASPQNPFVYWAFTTCKRPVQTPLYALIHLIFTTPYKVGAMHGPTLLTSKLRLRAVMWLAGFRLSSPWQIQFLISLWDSRARAVNDYISDGKR